MIKTQVFASSNMIALRDAINEFIKDKKVIDIKFSSAVLPSRFSDGCYDRLDVNDRALVIYEVEK